MLESGATKRFVLALCVLLIGISLGSCRESEQGRIREFKKGTYLGQPDQSLSQEQVDELRHRAQNQRI